MSNLIDAKERYSTRVSQGIQTSGWRDSRRLSSAGNLLYDSNTINLPPAGHSFAPFVKLTLNTKDGEEILTVGNRSRSPDNTAIIKRMQFGTSEGMGCTIEIFDEKGGNFEKAFMALNKSLHESTKDSQRLTLDFGWIIEKEGTICGRMMDEIKSETKDASKNSETVVDESKSFEVISIKNFAAIDGKMGGGEICLIPQAVKVAYEQGKIKYTLTCTDAAPLLAQARVECNLGTDKNKVDLKQAIRKLLKEKAPGPLLDVKFLDSKGKEKPGLVFKESDGGENGPKGVWESGQQDKLSTIRKWISPLRTSNDKGIIMYWDGTKESRNSAGTIILQEDPGPDLCGNGMDNLTSFGTYIVNGGEKSPVLSFSPSVNWNFAGIAKDGGVQSSVSGKQAKMEGEQKPGCKDTRDKGGRATYPATQGSWMFWRAPENQSEEAVKAEAAHQAANARMEGLQAIEAELRIIGDPRFCFPKQMTGSVISLIVINPYHLDTSSRSSDCADWLAKPLANPVFSNKYWMITGIDHQIQEGSFVTTLKINLNAPGISINPDVPIGGEGSGGQAFSINTTRTGDVKNDDSCNEKQ